MIISSKGLKYFKSFLLIFVGVIAVDVLGKETVDYCDRKICPYQGVHVGCKHDGSFAKICTGDLQLADMSLYKDLILHEHNNYRNILASGELKCFPPAARMPALEWDDELAKNAEFNVKSCVFAHDKCRSTKHYPYAGQNIYYARTNKLNITMKDFLIEGMFLWYEEYMHADAKLMKSFRKTTPQTGHFTLMMNDRNIKVGCAALKNTQLPEKKRKNPRRMILFTCDYTSTNIRNRPSYQPGAPGSLCHQRHEKFNSLCADDSIDPNDIDWYNDKYE